MHYGKTGDAPIRGLCQAHAWGEVSQKPDDEGDDRDGGYDRSDARVHRHQLDQVEAGTDQYQHDKEGDYGHAAVTRGLGEWFRGKLKCFGLAMMNCNILEELT